MTPERRRISIAEIVAVVIIVACVAMVIVPAVNRYLERERVADCASDMDEIAKAIAHYASDYNGRVPPAYYLRSTDKPADDYLHPPAARPSDPDSVKTKYPELWTGRIAKYLHNRNAFICPLVANDSSVTHYFYRPKPAIDASPWTTYGMNWRFSNGGALGGEPFHPKKDYVGVVQTLDSPPIPSRTVLLIETQNGAAWNGSGNRPLTGEIAWGGNIAPFKDTDGYFWAIRWLDAKSFTPYGHSGGCNAVLADGHASFIPTPAPPYPPKTSQIEQQQLTWW